MSGTLIWLFRHLEHQNLSIISGDIGRAKSKFSIFTQGCLVQIFTTRGLWRHLQIISSCWELCYSCLDTLNIKIHLLFQKIQAEQVGCKIFDGTHTEDTHTDSLRYYLGYISVLSFSSIYVLINITFSLIILESLGAIAPLSSLASSEGQRDSLIEGFFLPLASIDLYICINETYIAR